MATLTSNTSAIVDVYSFLTCKEINRLRLTTCKARDAFDIAVQFGDIKCNVATLNVCKEVGQLPQDGWFAFEKSCKDDKPFSAILRKMVILRAQTIVIDGPTEIPLGHYSRQSQLVHISSKTVTTIDAHAFDGNRNESKLVSVSFPNTERVEENAFIKCISLADVFLPSVLFIGINAFAFCKTLRELSLPKVETLANGTFSGCTSLTKISCPELTHAYPGIFAACHSLTSVYLPKLESVSNSMFYSCRSLKEIDLQSVTTIGYKSFEECTVLNKVRVPMIREINPQAFSSRYTMDEMWMSGIKINGIEVSKFRIPMIATGK